ncbi:MAG: hypothetical protein CL680_17725 [Blastomonas sp.]|jgi:DNA repair protein RadC|nr:hypothetical protein [Blastomonas sp.]|tara:strand:+ start:28315 stop:29157 length:843 start_codon:yes stop_codon:yes gene_type:complete
MTGETPDAARISGLHALTGSRVSPGSRVLREHLQATLGILAHEALEVLFLDQGHVLIAHERLLQGSAQRLLLEPGFIFRRALALGASAVILAHNHPSGDPRPSPEDLEATQWLVRMGRMLGVEIAEHLIVVRRGCHAMLRTPITRPTALAAFFDLKDSAQGCIHEKGSVCPTAAANARLAAWHRNRRRELIGHPSLLANPAWDMLIDLFLHTGSGRQVSTSALCIGSGVPMSTALRLISKLCESRIVARNPDPMDGRRKFITLPAQTLEGLNEYFCGMTR